MVEMDKTRLRADLPIGFLDSGVGGLTVVKQALRQLPNETIRFIGDQARLPYGPRPAEQVVDFTWQMVHFLEKQGIKMLVIACNTATAAALPDLQKKMTIPVIGVIDPGSKAAIKASKNGHIGVIATEGTVKSGSYARAIHTQNATVDVQSVACPKFVTLVESNEYQAPIAKQIVAQGLQPFSNSKVDTLVMGCTHYPLLRPLIQNVMGSNVTLIDSGAETVNVVAQLLDVYHMAAKKKVGEDHYFTTGSPAMFKTIAMQWLELSGMNVDKAVID
ncbi:glutamate racemase [Furfurilactobacillus rossiae]|uniref:Glutamate racemase n=2 Tax=Furfurilactobacillus rossiae TaxID=231049 RepID=A0A0R1RIQ6_9LACO|nr:glutamate racemase [Furfurilactobacillus rossiae DSM 15814]MCF6166539.1 glutamate racemase [Furfurilactobacillus rossiae]QLE61755.1 Glutamate racemase [Furfurilactobacillus rossiae]QLE64555.1 Glutamate racemase [Furfurilactobacillus rossiae]